MPETPTYTPHEPRFPDIHVQLTGLDSNIASLMGAVTTALRRNGHSDQCAAVRKDVFTSESYVEALHRLTCWVSVS